MNDDIVLNVPSNAQIVGGGNVSHHISDVKFECPCCGVGTTVEPPRSECGHCGATLAIMVGHGQCPDTDG